MSLFTETFVKIIFHAYSRVGYDGEKKKGNDFPVDTRLFFFIFPTRPKKGDRRSQEKDSRMER